MKRIVPVTVLLAACGCSGQAFSQAGDGAGDAAPGAGGNPATALGATGGEGSVGSTGGVTGAGSGGVRATGGAPTGKGGTLSTGGAPSTGGVAVTGGAPSSVDDGGVVDAGRTCVTDLSGVGTGDFRISFTLVTTESVLTLELLSQRVGCDDTSAFWDISLGRTGGITASTSDGAHLVVVEAGNSLNDGKPHGVDVIRRGGMLWYASDGMINSTPSPDPYSFGTFPPLVLGSSACAGTTPAAGHATISDVCLSE